MPADKTPEKELHPITRLEGRCPTDWTTGRGSDAYPVKDLHLRLGGYEAAASYSLNERGFLRTCAPGRTCTAIDGP